MISLIILLSTPIIIGQAAIAQKIKDSNSENSLEVKDNDLIVAAVSGGIAFIATYVTAYLKVERDLRSQYNVALRDKRIEAYKDLWKHLKPLAFHSLENQIKYSDLKQLSDNLLDWYYGLGGMLLSEGSQKDFTEFQDKKRRS